MRKKEVIKLIGEDKWPDFCKWMEGQTIGSYANGDTNYYDWDVDAYVRKIKTGYDRQEDSLAWD